MKKIIFTLICFLLQTVLASDKVLIMTYVHSRPDFIELHEKTFKAFLQNDYEYIVFNDAPSDSMRKQIEQTCNNLGIQHFRVPQHLHIHGRTSPGHRHMDAIKYSLEVAGYKHDGIVVMIDADMFLVKPLDIIEYMQEYNFIGGYQDRIKGDIRIIYTSPCLTFMNMRTLPNKDTISFEGGYIHGLACDVGAHTYYYFKNNPTINLYLYTAVSKDHLCNLSNTELQALGYDTNTINFLAAVDRKYGFEFHGDTYFMHYYAGGSNWPGYSSTYLQEKNNLLNNYINQQIETYKNEK